MAQLLADEAPAGAALEEDFPGFGVLREQVDCVVDELKGAAVAGGARVSRQLNSDTKEL